MCDICLFQWLPELKTSAVCSWRAMVRVVVRPAGPPPIMRTSKGVCRGAPFAFILFLLFTRYDNARADDHAEDCSPV